ncbi:hypothetical protein [Ideonella sp. BN130291]|uniref:hypothetical protein n=1 Tax=Ideonella sp. BN130291 TaxID=3112940 RepID=UPI002E26CE41|nr:hypothetical protein [Ideonella sp. BN130291]
MTPLPVPEVLELLELPQEFDGWPPSAQPAVEQQARLSVELARERQQQLQVLQLDDPSTTLFALFL